MHAGQSTSVFDYKARQIPRGQSRATQIAALGKSVHLDENNLSGWDVSEQHLTDASLLYAKYEQMRQGTCQYPEALQIPDQDKAVYLENVVGGKLPTNLKDLAIANRYLEKVRCNFTPMLMANSTS